MCVACHSLLRPRFVCCFLQIKYPSNTPTRTQPSKHPLSPSLSSFCYNFTFYRTTRAAECQLLRRRNSATKVKQHAFHPRPLSGLVDKCENVAWRCVVHKIWKHLKYEWKFPVEWRGTTEKCVTYQFQIWQKVEWMRDKMGANRGFYFPFFWQLDIILFWCNYRERKHEIWGGFADLYHSNLFDFAVPISCGRISLEIDFTAKSNLEQSNFAK